MFTPDAGQTGKVSAIYIRIVKDPDGFLQAIRKLPGSTVDIYVCTADTAASCTKK
jgi:hypothetical protein